MRKEIVLLIFVLVLAGLSMGKMSAAQFQTKTCGELFCNPAPNLFSTSLCPDTPCDARQIISSIIKLALGLSGLIAVAYVIFGGFQLITARGDDNMVKSGRKTLTNAIIGLVIIILSHVIVSVAVNAAYGRIH